MNSRPCAMPMVAYDAGAFAPVFTLQRKREAELGMIPNPASPRSAAEGLVNRG
jgi:hypothetical protein